MSVVDKTYCEHYRDGLPFCAKCEADRAERNEQMHAQRAEIERLALLAQNQQIVIDAQSRSIQAKDALIEQMREAISDVLRHAEPPQHDIRGCIRANCWWCYAIRARDAALSAAERGEG